MTERQQITRSSLSNEVHSVARQRPLTQARRAQNRAAQARYRLKQKRIAEASTIADHRVESEIRTSGSPPKEQFEPANPLPSYLPNQPTSFDPVEAQLDTWATSSIASGPLDSLNLSSSGSLIASTAFDELCDNNYAAGSERANTPMRSICLSDMQHFLGEANGTIRSSHIPAIPVQLEEQTMTESLSSSHMRTTLPSGTFLLTNHIRLHDMTFLAATLAIAESIDVTADDYFNDRPSPFYLLSNVTSIQSAANYFQERVKPHLQPSLTQLSRPHASYLDLIIFPKFRERAVVSATSDPCLLDQPELISDMLEGGLTCWGNTERSITGRGGGVPWDMRSWEAKPWFLKKWWFLLGNDNEMREISQWWWQMRGEDADEAALMSSW